MRFTIVRKAETGQFDYEVFFVMGEEIGVYPDQGTLALCGLKKGQVCNLPEKARLYVRVEDYQMETLRLAAAKAYGSIADYKIKSVVFHLPPMPPKGNSVGKADPGTDPDPDTLQALVEGLELGSYRFDKYKKDRKEPTLEEIALEIGCAGNTPTDSGLSQEAAQAAVKRGKIIADATNYTRDIVNEIPQIYTPVRMAEDAEKLASRLDRVSCQVFGPDYLRQENMNAFLAVSQASPNEPRLIHLAYQPKTGAKQKVAFVGKGLTFDSGGLCLKSSGGRSMKSDKGGAAAAMGILYAAAMLELPIEVHSVLGCTENMIGSRAYKPDDVIVSRSGVTIEVGNTDCEGRMVLSDCLSWTQDMVAPDLMIDLATLTGAVVTGLGEYTSGVIGNNFDLQMDFKKIGSRSGELLTVLEFNDYLRKMIDSSVADVCNTASGRGGGALTAGLFLDHFVEEEYKDRWLHLDIAGPAFLDKKWGYNPAGASGAGVRASVYYLMDLATR